MIETGPASELLSHPLSPLHPRPHRLHTHSRAPGKVHLASIPGSPPSLFHPEHRCRFAPRARWRRRCAGEEEPALVAISGVRVACHVVTKWRSASEPDGQSRRPAGRRYTVYHSSHTVGARRRPGELGIAGGPNTRRHRRERLGQVDAHPPRRRARGANERVGRWSAGRSRRSGRAGAASPRSCSRTRRARSTRTGRSGRASPSR